MSWDETNRWIVGPVNTGDIQKATGCISDDYGTLCGENNSLINSLALWKPFRNPAKGFAYIADQRAAIKAARCGFKAGVYGLPHFFPMEGSGLNIPHAVWVYQQPRGVGGGDNGEDEIYRITDFSPVGSTFATGGYYPDAVLPIYVSFPGGGIVSGDNYVLFKFDDAAYGETGGRWKPNFCMSFDDIVPAASYGNYKFALVFQSTNGTSVVVSDTTVSQAASNRVATIHFTASQVSAIPANAGDDVACAICLVSPSWNAGVYNGSSQFNDYVLSLEVKSGCDRTTLKYLGQGLITGMTGSLNITMGSKTPSSITGFSCYYPIAQVDFTVTAGSNWGTRTSVGLQLELVNSNALGTATQPGQSSAVVDFSVALAAGETKTFTAYFVYGVNNWNWVAYAGSSADSSFYAILKAVGGGQTLTLDDHYQSNPIILAK